MLWARLSVGNLFNEKLNFRTVDVLLLDAKGRLLLQKLPDDHLRSPGKLGASVAGYLLAGEDYAEAAQRKMKSELGLSASLIYLGEVSMEDDGCRKFVGVFTGRIDRSPSFDRNEIEEIVYMKPSSD